MFWTKLKLMEVNRWLIDASMAITQNKKRALREISLTMGAGGLINWGNFLPSSGVVWTTPPPIQRCLNSLIPPPTWDPKETSLMVLDCLP